MRVTINLSSRVYIHQPALYTGYALLGAVLVFLLLFQAYDLLQWHRQTRFLRSEIEKFEVQLGKRVGAEATLDDLESLAAGIRQAEELLSKDHYRWTGLLQRLEEVVGPRIRLTSIQPNFKEKSLRIQAQARDVEALRQFLRDLSGSKTFQDYDLLSQNRTQAGNDKSKTVVDFSLVIREALQ